MILTSKTVSAAAEMAGDDIDLRLQQALDEAKRVFEQLWAEPVLGQAQFAGQAVFARYSQKLRASSCSRALAASYFPLPGSLPRRFVCPALV
jgi:hypothetical protein